MLFIHLLIVIIFFLIIFIICYKTYQNNIINKHLSFINSKKKLYPELETILYNKDDIITELSKILYNDNWIIWNNPPNLKNEIQIMNFIKNNHVNINKHNYSYPYGRKIFGLILNGNIVVNGLIACPRTTFRLAKLDFIINAGFSCIDGYNNNNNNNNNNNIMICNENYYRCYIPLIIPPNNSGIKIDNTKINLDNEDDYFIFDDKNNQIEWNYSDKKRIALILDIKKK
jgi:hypothetical protein